jgi:hypothetical protein
MPWEKFVEYFTDISMCQLFMPLEIGVNRRAFTSMKASRRSTSTPIAFQYHEWVNTGTPPLYRGHSTAGPLYRTPALPQGLNKRKIIKRK